MWAATHVPETFQWETASECWAAAQTAAVRMAALEKNWGLTKVKDSQKFKVLLVNTPPQETADLLLSWTWSSCSTELKEKSLYPVVVPIARELQRQSKNLMAQS